MFNKNSLRKLVLYLIATVFIAYGAGTAMLMASNDGHFSWARLTNTVSVDQEENHAIDSVDDISINVSSAKINIISEDRADVRAHLSGAISSSSTVSKPELQTSLDGNKLMIEVKSQNFFVGFVNLDLTLDVYIPNSYAQDLNLKTSSGDIDIQNIKLNNLSCTLSSGKLSLNNIEVNKFIYKSSSGDLDGNNVRSEKSDLVSSSGKITMDSFTGDINAELSSGDIEIAYTEFNNDVDIHVSSGKIELKLPEDSEFGLTARASSGDVSCKFPITITDRNKDNFLEGVVKSDKNKIELNSSSGDIKIYK